MATAAGAGPALLAGPEPGSDGARRGRAGAPGSVAGSLAPSQPASPGAHLLLLIGLLEARVRAAVGARRAVDPDPDDAFRGLYVSEEDVDRLLAGGWPALPAPSEELIVARRSVEGSVAAGSGGPGHPSSRISEVVRRFQLEAPDVDLLVAAVAPDVDARFERLYGYLNDDVTRRRATIGLALELSGLSAFDAAGRARLGRDAPLLAGGLVVVEDADRPFLTRSLRVPDRVIAHLLGGDRKADELEGLVLAPGPESPVDAGPLARVLLGGAALVHIRERPGSAGRLLAEVALREAGFGALSLDCGRFEPEADVAALARLAGREARLSGSGIVAGPLEALLDGDRARGRSLVRAFAELPVPVVLLSRASWDPDWSIRVPLTIDAAVPDAPARLAAWLSTLPDGVDEAAITEAVSAYRLAPGRIARAAKAARLRADFDGKPLGAAAVRAGARGQNAAGLEKLARRIEPAVSFEDLVLPPVTERLLRELVARMRYRDQVIGEWGMRQGGGRGQGVTGLFAGESGTGKTMSAEVVAGTLGLELYTINLATVVDKYVGETEKNLERIFSEVDGVNGVLLFDEADALFGKRSEVRDAHDRYANIEVAYLLQRIESFDGLAILATNLRANVDEAFTRRLDAVVDFPFPDVTQRRALWEKGLGTALPLGEDVDVGFLAQAFELSGGNISSIALTAGYLAAAGGGVVTMPDLVRAVHREYRKLGRLSVRAEFGEWFDVLAEEIDA